MIAALAILWSFSVCAAADPAPISGFYYQDELSKPLPGALIALYSADNNLFIDSTYTRNDGAFVLKGPATKGKYYVVATKDQFSHKFEFDYDPQAAPPNLMIQHHQPENKFVKILGYVWERFDDVIKLLIGFLFGLLFKWYEDRKKAGQVITREIKTIQDSSGEIVNQYEELKKIGNAYGSSGETEVQAQKRLEFTTLATQIGTQAELLLKAFNDNTSLKEALYTKRKLAGRNDYAAFKTAVTEVKKLTETIVATPGPVLADRDTQLKPFETLRDSNLLKKY